MAAFRITGADGHTVTAADRVTADEVAGRLNSTSLGTWRVEPVTTSDSGYAAGLRAAAKEAGRAGDFYAKEGDHVRLGVAESLKDTYTQLADNAPVYTDTSHNGFDEAGDPIYHPGPRQECPDPVCENFSVDYDRMFNALAKAVEDPENPGTISRGEMLVLHDLTVAALVVRETDVPDDDPERTITETSAEDAHLARIPWRKVLADFAEHHGMDSLDLESITDNEPTDDVADVLDRLAAEAANQKKNLRFLLTAARGRADNAQEEIKQLRRIVADNRTPGDTLDSAAERILALRDDLKAKGLEGPIYQGVTPAYHQLKALTRAAHEGEIPCSIPNMCEDGELCTAHEEQHARAEGEDLDGDEDEGGYRVRARLLGLLATFIPAVTTPCAAPTAPGIAPDEEGWKLLYLTLDGQQLSFHIAPCDAYLFEHVEQVDGDDPRAQWDGHTTPEKWARVLAYIASGGNETVHLAVDVVCVRPDGRFLGIQRRWAPHEGKWALPGGHVKPGEDARHAAAREGGEETGVHVDPADLTEVGAFHRPGRDPRGRYVSIAYLAHVPEGTEAVADDDARNTAWLPVGIADQLAFDHREIVTTALKVKEGESL